MKSQVKKYSFPVMSARKIKSKFNIGTIQINDYEIDVILFSCKPQIDMLLTVLFSNYP